MGLSIISNSSASINRAALPTLPNLTEGLPGEFAALLSGQTLAAMMPQADTSEAADPSSPAAVDIDKGNSASDEATGTIASSSDPAALMAMIGNPQPEISNRKPSIAELPKDLPARDVSPPALTPGSEKQVTELNMSSGRTKTTGERGNFIAPQAADSKTAPDTLPEKAANIAAELSEKHNETTPFISGMSAVLPQRNVTSDPRTAISTPLHAETWPQQFSEKIVWLAKNDQQSAQINISPPQLGPVQITLNLNGDQATAVFSSPHADVRQAIENSMPQLREMLASAGINLGDANVGANLAQQNQNNPFMMANKNQSKHENAILPANDNAPSASIGQALQKGRGLVDLFA
jgi:flagellar hook-length control protein FliK